MNSAEQWDPTTHQDPVRALTQRIRQMPVGASLKLPSGTVVKSVPMKHGATHVRRFAVAVGGKTRLPRVGSLQNTIGTAAQAAEIALKGE